MNQLHFHLFSDFLRKVHMCCNEKRVSERGCFIAIASKTCTRMHESKPNFFHLQIHSKASFISWFCCWWLQNELVLVKQWGHETTCLICAPAVTIYQIKTAILTLLYTCVWVCHMLGTNVRLFTFTESFLLLIRILTTHVEWQLLYIVVYVSQFSITSSSNQFQIKVIPVKRKMSFQIVSCEDQYRKFPQLNRSEVLELLEWKKTQPHLPNITGRLIILQNYFFSVIYNFLV